MFKKILLDGIETNYSVSDSGEIKNDSSNRIMTINQGVVQLYINKKNKRLSVGKLVAQAFIPKSSEDEVYVTHIDGDVNNNNVDNLLWITAQENSNNTWKKRRENNTTGAGEKRQSRKRENIVENTNYSLKEDERQIMLDGIYIPYSVDIKGNVKNLKNKKFLKGSILNSYRYINFRWNGNNKNKAVHRLVAEAFLPNPKNLPIVDHIDGDRLNNNINNLRWVDYVDNSLNIHLDKTPKKPLFEKVPYTDEEILNEVWKEYNGYKISNLGRVMGKNKTILKGSKQDSGYIVYSIGSKRILGHILVWTVFKGKKSDKNNINHINGNKQDNRLSNLEEVTHQENMFKAANETKVWNFREVEEIDDSNNVLRIFNNASAAARAIGILPSSMRNTIRRNGKCYNGLRYRYVE